MKQYDVEMIFDSREAKKNYTNGNYYRSKGIYIPPGYVALVELTAGKDNIKNMTFTAVRTPVNTKISECYETSKCMGKRYRRWKCCQSLGAEVDGTQFDEFNKSIVRWGNDKINEEIVEFEWIDRPGNYYLISEKCTSPAIEDCATPTIFEASIMPANMAFQLGYACYKSCPDE